MHFDYRSRVNTKIQETAIGQMLSQMSMESVFYTHSDLRSPWAISLPPIPQCMMFHLVLDGTACIDKDNHQVTLNKGDFALLPGGQGHKLYDGSATPPTPLHELPIMIVSDRYETLTYGGAGKSCRLICGAVTFSHPLTMRLTGLLPQILSVRGSDKSCGQVINTLSELIMDETRNTVPGFTGVISKLADILVVTAIRNFLDTEAVKVDAIFGALKDPRITKAIELVHTRPSTHWSLAELAREVGMSRTNFAVQFKHLVGHSPMDYLTEWRMSLAFSALQQTTDTVLSIALDYGYQSESAFSRAFKKITGSSPGEVRKQALAAS